VENIHLLYALIADAYEKIEATTKRLEMTDHLVGLLKQTPKDLIDKVVYLTQGKLYPDFVGIEIGIAEKLAVRAVTKATGHSEKEIEESLKKTGDLGKTAQKFLEEKAQVQLSREPLTVEKVYGDLDKMAKAMGAGSMDLKINLLAGLLANATSKEAKFIVRTVTGQLRLGIADMTVLDALAIAYGGGKEAREDVERAYNISADLGRVARAVVEKGVEGIKKFEVSIGEPIRPMLAERLGSPEEILEKLGGKCIAEYKYDGERIQAHKKENQVTLFSRRLEDITDQYPDVTDLFRKYVKAKDAIIEAECVAIDPDTKEMKPFQELMHRRRKYGIKKAMEEYPVSLFMFDALYVDGKDLTLEPYSVRHKILEKIIEQADRVRVAEYLITDTPEELERFFEKAVEDGCEGLICKSVNEDAPDEDSFKTATKCGTGFTDEELKKLPGTMEKHRIPHRHPRVQSTLEADVWFEPTIVIETIGAEITLSPIHTCAINVIRKGSGLAIRFPRFTGNYRLDKSAEDSTTVNEIVQMYRSQLKKFAE